MKSGNKLVAYLKLIAVVIIWGGNYHAAKYLVKDTDIYTVSFLRFALAALVLLFIQHNKHGAMGYKKSPLQWWMLIAIGFVGIFIYNMFFFGAESLIPANNVAILYAFTPCITVVFSSIFLKQKISCLGYVGVIIALVGTIGVINTSDTNCGKFFCGELFKHLSLGELLAILATVSMSCYNILNRKAALMNLDPLHITTFGAVFGAIFLFITFLLFGGKVILLWHKPWSFWLAMFYTAILATVIGYKWYSEAIREIGVGPTAVFQNGVPFSAILIGLILVGHGVSWEELVSGVVIVAGVLITNLAISRKA